MTDDFERVFGHRPHASARAPGRVNLIGEHTDYNGGYVLPVAIPLTTDVAISRRTDCVVHGISRDVPDGHATYCIGSEQPCGNWLDYVQGVTKFIRQRSSAVRGFNFLVSSQLPIGKGLSSSASLEIAMCRALRTAFDLPLDDIDIARIAHQAEFEFVGAPVGIMDQMACSLGDTATALFLDASTAQFERIPLPADVEIGVVDSGIAHHHASGDYRTRRGECEEAARQLRVNQLRELSLDDLPRIADLPEPLNRRARHVVTENARVLAAVAAIRGGDNKVLGQLMYDSHASMRDDFAVSLPEIDRLVSMAAEDPRVIGARLTGGGFGGSIIVLCGHGEAVEITSALADRYRTVTKRPGRALVP